MDANQLRNTFTQFFVDRGHTAVASAGLIPLHPMAPLFTNAGMNQFFPYFLGEEAAPYPRATSIQKCVRIRGKQDDIENIGRTTRHLTFFEMMGNFSFGDYFKEGAIKNHWELFTGSKYLNLDGDKLWVTVHHSDDTAAEIWHDVIGVPAERIQRLGSDNFWEAGDTGPCGPCTELFIDLGPAYGEDGGPEHGGEHRFIEIGNLVFMEFEKQQDGGLVNLPKQNVDTGSGYERLLSVLEGEDSLFKCSAIAPIVEAAQSITGRKLGSDEEVDVSLRILADHSRSMTFLVNDGVFPSNEDRGYVLRRIVRRMFRHTYKLGGPKNVTAAMVQAVVDTMAGAYPEIKQNQDFITDVLSREEDRFYATLQSGSNLLDTALDKGDVTGETAFKLHDTFGFPIELTREIASERGRDVDEAGFTEAMEGQRTAAREAAKAAKTTGVSTEAYRELLDAYGSTESLAYTHNDTDTKIIAVLVNPDEANHVELFVEATPFYAERGGQIGDTGHITTDTGTARVIDTTWAVPGLVRHLAKITDGRIEAGQAAHAAVDSHRRDEIRRNHTGTHIIHWAFREVLGHHVKQAGSLVHPDYLRFDFSHFQGVTPEELAQVERLANLEILTNGAVTASILPYDEAISQGAIAFFDEKYDALVRMVQAGEHSLELCGGTHCHALGDIGPMKIISEGSIGSNLRRIVALTGEKAIDFLADQDQRLARAAGALKAKPDELEAAIERSLAEQKRLSDELKRLQAAARQTVATSLWKDATDGRVIARVDDLPADQLRDLALDIRQKGAEAVVLVGSPDGEKVSLVAATKKGGGLQAGDLVGPAARVVGGGGGKGADFAMAGGRDTTKIEEALAAVRATLANA